MGRANWMVLSSLSPRGQTWGVVITNSVHQDGPIGRWIHRDCLLFWQVSVLVNLLGNYRMTGTILTWGTWLAMCGIIQPSLFPVKYWATYRKWAQNNFMNTCIIHLTEALNYVQDDCPKIQPCGRLHGLLISLKVFSLHIAFCSI